MWMTKDGEARRERTVYVPVLAAGWSRYRFPRPYGICIARQNEEAPEVRHIVTSEGGKPGMTLDQLQVAVEQARRAGATGSEIVRARLFGRGRGLRSITVDLDEPVADGGSTDGGNDQPGRRRRAQTDR